METFLPTFPSFCPLLFEKCLRIVEAESTLWSGQLYLESTGPVEFAFGRAFPIQSGSPAEIRSGTKGSRPKDGFAMQRISPVFARWIGRALPATLTAMTAWLWLPGVALAQHGPHAAVSVPFNQTGDGFFEQIGVNFGFNVGNFFFQQNGGAPPPFGGGNPGAGLNTGFNVHAPGGFNGHFNITASQGARTSMVSQTVTTTVPNGVPGFVSDTSQTPFVLGVIPVVGDGGTSPVRERLERIKEGGAAAYGPRGGSTASAGGASQRSASQKSLESAGPTEGGQADGGPAPAGAAGEAPAGSVAQLQQVRAAAEAAQRREIEAIVAKGEEAEAAGKPGQARIFYRQAANRAASPVKEQLLARAARLTGAAAAKPKSIQRN